MGEDAGVVAVVSGGVNVFMVGIGDLASSIGNGTLRVHHPSGCLGEPDNSSRFIITLDSQLRFDKLIGRCTGEYDGCGGHWSIWGFRVPTR